MSYFKAKIRQIRFWLELSGPARGAYSTPQTLKFDLRGLLLREGEKGCEGTYL